MPRTSPPLLPRLSRLLDDFGERLKLARLRRRHTAEQIAERAGISRKTLSRVEQGDPSVALGIYARVLQALRLEQDLASVAADDDLGRKLQDADLLRAPRMDDEMSTSPTERIGHGRRTLARDAWAQREVLVDELRQRHQKEGRLAVEPPPELLIRDDRER